MITNPNKYLTGRLTARPDLNAIKAPFMSGVNSFGMDDEKDGLIYIPKHYSPDRPAALALMLHGAGGTAEHGLSYLRHFADESNIILLAPASRSSTWDIISFNTFGPDVVFIDQVLAFTFEKFAIDPERIAIGGFSDGASYALSMGLTNGALFSHIIAFSPGFMFTKEKTGKPAVFMSHGTKDPILPIEPCSRKIVPQLKRQGLDINYLEFDGKHEIPPHIAKSGIQWFLSGKNRPRSYVVAVAF